MFSRRKINCNIYMNNMPTLYMSIYTLEFIFLLLSKFEWNDTFTYINLPDSYITRVLYIPNRTHIFLVPVYLHMYIGVDFSAIEQD